MNRLIRAFLCLLLLGVSLITASAADRKFPPPELGPEFKMPVPTAPAVRAEWFDYQDLMVLALTLSLSTFFVLKKRSRDSVMALSVFSLLYFGFYRKGCICAIGSIQDVTLALFNSQYAVPLTVLGFFLLPLIFSLIFGRTFCAAVCPMGAIQDLVLLKPMKVHPTLAQLLGVIPFIYLGAAILFAATGSAFIICEYDPFVAFYRRSGSFEMLMLGTAVLVLGIYVGRPYCRFLCPYGALLSLVSRFSKWSVSLSPTDCVQCQICDVACPYGAIEEPTSPISPAAAGKAKLRLALMLVLLPLLIGIGGWLGSRLNVPFSRAHATVQLAERVAAEDAGKVKDVTDASQAFRKTGRPVEELYAEATQIRSWFVSGGWFFGGFVGLVFGVKLISLSVRQKRAVFDPDPAACVSCGRCYVYCPKEISRVKRVQRQNSIPLASTGSSGTNPPCSR